MSLNNYLYCSNTHLVFSDTKTFRKILGVFRFSHLPQYRLDEELDELLIQSLLEENSKQSLYGLLSYTHFVLGTQVINDSDNSLLNILIVLNILLGLNAENSENEKYKFVWEGIKDHLSEIAESDDDVIDNLYELLKSILFNDSKSEFISLCNDDGLSIEDAEEYLNSFSQPSH